MYKIFSLLIISILFVGCTNKNSAFKYFEKSEIQSKAVQNSKKTDILESNEPKVIFWATYINNIDKEEKGREIFLVSLYFVNEENQDLFFQNYKFSLNGKEPVLVELADNNNKDFKELMLKNTWGNHYIVEFEEVLNNYKLDLKLFKESTDLQGQLNFEK